MNSGVCPRQTIVAGPILLISKGFWKAHFDIGAKRDVAMRGRRASPPNVIISASTEVMIYKQGATPNTVEISKT